MHPLPVTQVSCRDRDCMVSVVIRRRRNSAAAPNVEEPRVTQQAVQALPLCRAARCQLKRTGHGQDLLRLVPDNTTGA